MTRQPWEDIIDDEIRQVASNYQGRMGQRSRPARMCNQALGALAAHTAPALRERATPDRQPG